MQNVALMCNLAFSVGLGLLVVRNDARVGIWLFSLLKKLLTRAECYSDV